MSHLARGLVKAVGVGRVLGRGLCVSFTTIVPVIVLRFLSVVAFATGLAIVGLWWLFSFFICLGVCLGFRVRWLVGVASLASPLAV